MGEHYLNLTQITIKYIKMMFFNKQIVNIKKKMRIDPIFSYSDSEIALKVCRNKQRIKFNRRTLWCVCLCVKSTYLKFLCIFRGLCTDFFGFYKCLYHLGNFFYSIANWPKTSPSLIFCSIKMSPSVTFI